MDKYTKKTKKWLDKRFKSTDEKGAYKSHAPIYGFAKDFLSLGLYKNNYTILREIEKVSSEYKIDSFLEVGCAEGYTTYLVKEIFRFRVNVCDLSFEAVKRAKEIYGFRSFVADVQALGNIKSDSFDLVLCSETIEHVPNPKKAFEELMRVAKKVLIITVPAAKNKKEKESFVPPETPHTHLNIFTKAEIENFTRGGKVGGISLKRLNKIEELFTSYNKDNFSCNSKYLMGIYKIIRFSFSPVKKLYGVNIAKIFIRLDYSLCGILLSRVFTYMVVFKKVFPEFKNKPKKYKNILDYMLKESKVEPYFLKNKTLNNDWLFVGSDLTLRS